jgi:hypothetical protein
MALLGLMTLFFAYDLALHIASEIMKKTDVALLWLCLVCWSCRSAYRTTSYLLA